MKNIKTKYIWDGANNKVVVINVLSGNAIRQVFNDPSSAQFPSGITYKQWNEYVNSAPQLFYYITREQVREYMRTGKHPVKGERSVKTTKGWIENNPLVTFSYEKHDDYQNHTVRVISMDDDYLIGLDINDRNRFKRFSRSKIYCGCVYLTKYNPSAMGKMAKKQKVSVSPVTKIRKQGNIILGKKGEHLFSSHTDACVKCGAESTDELVAPTKCIA